MTRSGPIPEEILQAAKELGDALHSSPEVQAYLQACTAIQQDSEFQALESQLYARYEELTARQQRGEALPRADINAFYRLREEVVRHPLYDRRQTALQGLQTLFEKTGELVSSVLTVDFTRFVE